MDLLTYAWNPSPQEAEEGRSVWSTYTVRPWEKADKVQTCASSLHYFYLSFIECFESSQVQSFLCILNSYSREHYLLNDAG